MRSASALGLYPTRARRAYNVVKASRDSLFHDPACDLVCTYPVCIRKGPVQVFGILQGRGKTFRQVLLCGIFEDIRRLNAVFEALSQDPGYELAALVADAVEFELRRPVADFFHGRAAQVVLEARMSDKDEREPSDNSIMKHEPIRCFPDAVSRRKNVENSVPANR